MPRTPIGRPPMVFLHSGGTNRPRVVIHREENAYSQTTPSARPHAFTPESASRNGRSFAGTSHLSRRHFAAVGTAGTGAAQQPGASARAYRAFARRRSVSRRSGARQLSFFLGAGESANRIDEGSLQRP